MKISDLINFVDVVKPNAFSDAVKLSWINEVEGKIWCEIYLRDASSFVPHTQTSGTDLTVKPPHHKMYSEYLSAMIDFANGEYDKYENSMAMFNDSFKAYMRWYALTFRPADVARESEVAL